MEITAKRILVAAALMAAAPLALPAVVASPAYAQVGITFDLGNVGYGYRDGYVDRDRRYYRWRNAKEGIDDSGRRYPSANHPVVLRHPVSGRKSIYVNSFFTYAINELPEEESEAILNFLYSRFADPMFQTRFRWRKNSVAFWDNRAVQHLAIWDYFPHTRTGSRVTVKAAT